LRRTGVTAATFVVALVFALAVRAAETRGGPAAHSCTATDLSFIQTATLNVTALWALEADYKSGEVEGQALANEAFDSAKRVSHVTPKDPSLRLAQKYFDGMFMEYGTAVSLLSKGKDAGLRMRRAYGLSNFAHEVLAEAQPALEPRGCDVGPLL
jgi:hypothetical protein